MDLLQATTLDRLWTKYENRFGRPPPIMSMAIDDAIALLRRELARPGDSMAPAPPGVPSRDNRGRDPGSGAQAV